MATPDEETLASLAARAALAWSFGDEPGGDYWSAAATALADRMDRAARDAEWLALADGRHG